MKKSSGRPARIRGQELPERERPVPATTRTDERRRKWIGPVTAAAVVIILALIILPCQYRQCGKVRGRGVPSYRWVLSGVPSSVYEKHPVGKEARPIHGLNRRIPRRPDKPADKAGEETNKDASRNAKDQSGTSERSTPVPEKPKIHDFGTKLELVIPESEKR